MSNSAAWHISEAERLVQQAAEARWQEHAIFLLTRAQVHAQIAQAINGTRIFVGAA